MERVETVTAVVRTVMVETVTAVVGTVMVGKVKVAGTVMARTAKAVVVTVEEVEGMVEEEVVSMDLEKHMYLYHLDRYTRLYRHMKLCRYLVCIDTRSHRILVVQ